VPGPVDDPTVTASFREDNHWSIVVNSGGFSISAFAAAECAKLVPPP